MTNRSVRPDRYVDWDDGHAGGYPHYCHELKKPLVVKTRSGFELQLENIGFDDEGRPLWRQIGARLGDCRPPAPGEGEQ